MGLVYKKIYLGTQRPIVQVSGKLVTEEPFYGDSNAALTIIESSKNTIYIDNETLNRVLDGDIHTIQRPLGTSIGVAVVREQSLLQIRGGYECRRNATAPGVPITNQTVDVIVTICRGWRTELPKGFFHLYRDRDCELNRNQNWWFGTGRPNMEGRRIIAHPSRMAGDLWHIVLALVLDPTAELQCFSRVKNDRDAQRFEAVQLLAQKLGVGTRVFEKKITNSASDNVEPIEALRGVQVNGAIAGTTVCSTSIINFSTYAQGRDVIARRITDAFVNSLRNEDKELKDLIQLHVSRQISRLNESKRVLLVNMRIGGDGQNPQHNITQNMFNSVRDSVRNHRSKDIQLACVGKPPKQFDVSDAPTIDIYDEERLTPASATGGARPDNEKGIYEMMLTDKRIQPYFWYLMKQQLRDRLVGFVGGRSGGLDIASWMGVRCLSFDNIDPNDQHYLRLHWTSAYMSIIHLEGGDIDAAALVHWIDGNDLVPVLPAVAGAPGQPPVRPADPSGPRKFIGNRAAEEDVKAVAFVPKNNEGAL